MANDKVAIIGTRGCGKTVLLAVLTHQLARKDKNGFQIIPDNPEAMKFTSEKWHDLESGEWPAPTPKLVTPPIFKWKLRNGKKEKLMTTSDIAGEAWREFIIENVGDNAEVSVRSNWEKYKEKWMEFKKKGELHHQNSEEQIAPHLKAIKNLLNQSSHIFLLLNLKEIINQEPEHEKAMFLPIALANYMARIKRSHVPVTLVLTQTDQYKYLYEEQGDWAKVVEEYNPWIPQQFKMIIPIAAVADVKEKMCEDGTIKACPAPGFNSFGIIELYKNIWRTMAQADRREFIENVKYFLFKEIPLLLLLWLIYILAFYFLSSVDLVWGVFYFLIGGYICIKITKWLHHKR